MRGWTPLRLQWVQGTSQWWLSFLSPPFRGHFWLVQWTFCPLPAFCQRLTLQACSFFCLFFLSPLGNKTQLKLPLFSRLPLLVFFIMTFGSVPAWMWRGRLYVLHVFVRMFEKQDRQTWSLTPSFSACGNKYKALFLSPWSFEFILWVLCQWCSMAIASGTSFPYCITALFNLSGVLFHPPPLYFSQASRKPDL